MVLKEFEFGFLVKVVSDFLFLFQNCAMMGVQATSVKRKLDSVSGVGAEITPLVGETPCKTARWDNTTTTEVQGCQPTGDDCLARLRMVAATTPDIGPWRPTTTIIGRVDDDSGLVDDEDDWEDELSDYEELVAPCAPGRPQTPMWAPPQGYWGTQNYYQSPQTIRREENGKSYLELGAATLQRPQNVQCYRQRRLAVLNLSMCKLARYRQCSDPSLRRSVLICNTLRHIEREMENEGHAQVQNHQPQPQHHQIQPPQWYQPPVENNDNYLRELSTPSGRVTPFPHQSTQLIGGETPSSVDSGFSENSDSERTNINWGSVLSLTAHAGLSLDEPLNNNLELYQELGLTSSDNQPSLVNQINNTDSWDSFVQVLVTGT